MAELPHGTVTFLFTDIEGSTALWERDRTAMYAAVERHLALLDTAIQDHGGVHFKTVGDAVQAAFPTAPQAVAAALDGQRALIAEDWGAVGGLPVRMGLHAGDATPDDRGDYLAASLNRLARLLSAAHGGQIVASASVAELSHGALPPGVQLRDLGEHPLRDLNRPVRVFQLLHPDLPADFPPLHTLASRPNNLPLQPTPFLGREEQVAWLVDALRRQDVRLLTITGPGGVGKTRLALQVAADLLENFPDGVWFVDLSALTDCALVLPATGAALGMREGTVTTERLATALGSKRVLLVLDNFERVVEAAPAVAEVLAQVPGMKVLVTSRTPLHAYGEREYPLSPLPLPDPSRLQSLERLGQFESVRLFIERAQAVKPDFTVTSTNAPAVAEICYRLDGLPLAIELAAARVKVLPPQALLKRLEQRLPLLTGGARTAPARQQTMRDAIAWSHDFLSSDEQTAFRGLAVFAGGCTIDAAEAVAGAEGTLDVFATMTVLVDESLLRQEEGSGSEPRFRMLETVREYGLEQLEIHGEAEASRQRLADWCLALAEQAEPERYFGNIAPGGVARLDEELPNLRAAVTWLLAQGDTTRALRLLAATEDFWLQRHSTDVELHRWLQTTLSAAPDAPACDRALAHWLLSLGANRFGRDQEAMHHAERLLAVAEEWGDSVGLAIAHLTLGSVWEDRGDIVQAGAAYARAIPYWRAADGYEDFALHSQAGVGNSLVLQGNLEAGVSLLEDALARLRQDPQWFIVDVIVMRGDAALWQGDLSLAAQLLTEAIEATRSQHAPAALLGAMAGTAGVALARGHPEQAARLLGAVEAARELFGMRRSTNWPHAERITTNTRAALAANAFDQAWAAGRSMPLEEAVTGALAIADEAATGGNR